MLVPISWLKEYVNTKASPQELAEKITMGGVEVEEIASCGNDKVLNLAPTPNRGDCLSIIGVSREVSALYSKKFKAPEYSPPKGKGKMSDWVEIIVNDQKSCPRYTSRIVEGVKIGPSPEWLKKRVESAGIRSINNVIDATNFVLMELGQPVHAFDLKFLKGSKLIMDRPKSECKLMTLDGVEYIFGPDDIMNLDAEGAIGAAGIMGGEHSGVVDDTTTLVLESAYFDPKTVRRTSSRTGLASESSRRFEKGVDPETVIVGLHRLTELILDVAGGVPSSDWVDFYPKALPKTHIDLTLHEINWLLGTELTSKMVSDILHLVGCEVKNQTKDKFKVTVPSYRPDLTRSVDLIEEVARIYGYDKIKDTMPSVRISSLVKPPATDAKQEVRELLTSLGFFEAMTYGFASEEQLEQFGGVGEAIKLVNPLTNDMVYMRTTIVPALIKALEHNINRQIPDVKLFELNKVFMPSGTGLPNEKYNLAGVMAGSFAMNQWGLADRNVDFFDAKAALWQVFDRLGLERPGISPAKGKGFLHPTDSISIIYNDKEIGYCGRLHPKLEKIYDFTLPTYIFEVNFDVIKAACLKKNVSYKPISKYPIMMRDVALLVNYSITHKEMLQSFKKYVNKLVQSIDLFDIYSGEGIPEGKKSMAYRICFGSDERTLSDDDVEQAFNEIVERVKKDVKAEVR